jgi:hypothetical protein
MLISTEAPPMPSVTLSNQLPISGLGFQYELFWARMSSTNEIVFKNNLNNEGTPKLAGAHIGIEPFSGWALSGNATWQYGGGGRPQSATSFFDNLFSRTVLSTTPGASETDTRFANRTVSVTSAYTFPGPSPFEAYVEYGARDTLHGNLLRFHDTSLSAGVHFPELYKHFDLTIEASEWQQLWYSDYVWREGLTEYGYVIGNWGADWRTPGDPVGAQSVMAQLGWTFPSGNEIDVRVRSLQNQSYAVPPAPIVDYSRASMVTLEYAQPRDGYTRGLQLDFGRDVYGKGYGRLAAFARLDGGSRSNDRGYTDSDIDDESDEEAEARKAGFERFVDVGLSGGKLQLNLGGFTPAEEASQPANKNVVSPHLGLGVRKQVSANQDLGVRIEVDDFNSDTMLGLRVIDYRYRFTRHLAAGAFFGFARYAAPTPAQGYYEGAGVQWRDLLPHWDVSLDARYFDHLQRDKLLPSDPQNTDPVEWYNLFAPTLSISRRF